MDIGKIPPHDLEAEQAVIGSMLTDSDAVVEAIAEDTIDAPVVISIFAMSIIYQVF